MYTPLHDIHSGVRQGSILGPILYSLYTADLPTTGQTITATYADDTAILATHHDPVVASNLLQHHLNQTEQWMKRWRIQANETKSTHITFTMKQGDCPAVYLNGRNVPQDSTVKYLGIHLDRRLTWKTHIFAKRKHLGLLLQRMYWILGRKSELSLGNKVLLYKSILKPVWTYGIPLWGSASHPNIEILQRFQNKILRTMVNAPWYIPNKLLHTDLQMPTIREEITKFSTHYRAKLDTHQNDLTSKLITKQGPTRLKRYKPSDLPTRFI